MLTETFYIRNAACEAMSLGEEWMVLHAERFTVTKLNEAGGFCWELLAAEQSASSIAAALERRYQVDRPSTELDVDSFLRELLDYDLIRHAN